MEWLLCVLCLFFGQVTSENFTFTYDMAKSCKEYICQRGYLYDTFFKVDSDELKNEKSDESLLFEMHLAILGASNGHILLSTVAHPEHSDPVYEIVIGGGGNKFTELRRNLRRNAKASSNTNKILSPVEFRAFYIKISEDGIIEFGREGEVLPIFSFMDSDPITVNYFSFASWTGVEAKFLYDCPVPGSKSYVTPNSQAVDPKVSNSERLKRTLLMNKDPIMPPSAKVTVNLGVRITSVSYNAFDSKLTTGVSAVMKWTDNTLAWDPSKFNDTSALTFRLGQIWSPKFSIYNSDSVGMLEARSPELISMVNSGEATYHLHASINTWCYDYTTTMTRWPRDEYTCSVILQPWEAHERIALKHLDTNTMKLFATQDPVVLNAWGVNAKNFIVNVTTWNQMYPSNDNSTHQSDRFVVTVNLTRSASAYNIVFYTPLLVLVTFFLLSFWTEPLCMSRVWFYTSCVIIISMGLCYIDSMVPCHTVPTIFILYTAILGEILLALLVQVGLMTARAKQLCRTNFMQNILTAQLFRSVFCLPPIKAGRIYKTMDDEGDDDVSRHSDIEEMQTENVPYSEQREVAVVIDKTMFVIYSVAFAIMLGLHF